MRKIIHIDMDAFYASIEQRDNPEFRGKPLAVGYSGARGVVAAASYEARKYGVHSAMPSKTALYKCPDLIFASPRFDVYKQASTQINEIFHEYTDLVEPLSLDEAFLDVTVNHKNMASATLIAKEIKQKIKNVTGLTASAGISVNKFLAKIASDYKKPDGLFTIKPEDTESFVDGLKIERFFGVGKVTATKMHALDIFTGTDLKAFSEAQLVRHFGKTGKLFYRFARAQDDREVVPDRIRKSLGAENTFLEDLKTTESMAEEIAKIRDIVWERVSRSGFYGRTVTLKVKYADFRQITRSTTVPDRINDYCVFEELSNNLVSGIEIPEEGIRLLGLTVSHAEIIETPGLQLKIRF